MTELSAGERETDSVRVRTLEERDLDAIIRIDASSMGRERREFYRDRVASSLHGSRLRTSLVAEVDGLVVGFLMCTMHYGEFGRPEPRAVLDALGVHKDFRRKRVGRALMAQFLMNAGVLGVETVRTEVNWDNFDLLSFFAEEGFTPAPRLVLERSVT
jgi:ribosomal protein S18 acetylase RimI-like enzyme